MRVRRQVLREFLHRTSTGPELGPDHENLVYDLDGGMLVLDAVEGSIRFVEVLDRPDLGRLKSKS